MDNEVLTLRDKFAIEIMSAILTQHQNPDVNAYLNRNSDGKKRIEKVAILAYEAADIMRKVRLNSFT